MGGSRQIAAANLGEHLFTAISHLALAASVSRELLGSETANACLEQVEMVEALTNAVAARLRTLFMADDEVSIVNTGV